MKGRGKSRGRRAEEGDGENRRGGDAVRNDQRRNRRVEVSGPMSAGRGRRGLWPKSDQSYRGRNVTGFEHRFKDLDLEPLNPEP